MAMFQHNEEQYHPVLSMSPSPEAEPSQYFRVSLEDPLSLLLSPNRVEGSPQLWLEPESKGPTHRVVPLEPECRLSKCHLWQLQSDYYNQAGLDAWQHSIPNFVTSSVYIAEAYAELVVAFLKDYVDELHIDAPIYIVEMATGTGRFSYLMLRELERKLSRLPSLQHVSVRYVMTDFTEHSIEHWAQQAQLQPFVDKGWLDFAVWNPLESSSFQLKQSGQCVSSDTLKNPVIAISNYFFDSILQDMFRVKQGTVFEGLVTLERHLEGLPSAAPLHLSQIKPKFRYQALSNTQYYPDAALNQLLDFYVDNVPDGTIIFPVGAFEVVKHLQKMSNQQLVLLSSDKAYTSYQYMTYFDEHEYAPHDGAFSYMVNYDAMTRYFTQNGGVAFATNQHSLSLQTVCCVSVEPPTSGFEHLAYAFEERINRSNTYTSLCTLLPDDQTVNEVQQFNQLLAYIRLNLADPKIFVLLGQKLADLVHHASSGQKHDLLQLMEQARAQYYSAPGESNLPYWLSQLYYHLYHFEESIACLNQAEHDFGPHETLYYLQGQAYEKLENWPQAKAMYEQALLLKPDMELAHSCLQSVQNRLLNSAT